MTLDQFLDRLREEAPKHRWELVGEAGSLREFSGDEYDTNECRCPLEVLGDMDASFFARAAFKLGLPDNIAAQIIRASDSAPPRYTNGFLMGNHTRLRHEMLRICGLA
jgi:hypothetical protein